MLVNNDVNRGGLAGTGQPDALSWKQLKPSSPKSTGRRRRRLFAILSAVLLIAVIFTVMRVASVAANTNDQLTLTIGNQQSALLDLRQSLPISSYLYGANVFPEVGSSSIEANYTGFMSYGPQVVNGLKSAGINLLRFPGGNWGESQPLHNHILSYSQLYDFSNLLYATGAQGMIQARLSSPTDKYNQDRSLQERALFAEDWVDFMNNPNSQWRKLNNIHGQVHPVVLWSVGNEPDQLINQDTGAKYTVKDYVAAFIQFSIAMHNADPAIKVFGPEISQFFGVGVGPKDSSGELWMEGFLQGVAAYEKAHPKLPYHLLDGVSFHSYQFQDAATSPYLLMSSSEEWNYLLPQLRQLIRDTMGRDLPIAITEINSTPSTGKEPTTGQAALWWADTLGTLMNNQADYVSFFSAQGVDAPYPLFTSDETPQQTAMYRVFQMFTHMQHNLLPLQIQHDPVDAFATEDGARQTLSLMFVNKSGVNQTATISPKNTAFGYSPWHTQEVSIAPYSIVLITLHRGSAAAQAYSFDVPVSNAAALKPVVQTACGHKYDPLAFNIPC
ncbi:MAG TPA: hypothetical protein VNE38_10160 [Ktedonobacteraceae bacterium]|nr:hypothetical protein [Ktedonobacteraceae bacterium]